MGTGVGPGTGVETGTRTRIKRGDWGEGGGELGDPTCRHIMRSARAQGQEARGLERGGRRRGDEAQETPQDD